MPIIRELNRAVSAFNISAPDDQEQSCAVIIETRAILELHSLIANVFVYEPPTEFGGQYATRLVAFIGRLNEKLVDPNGNIPFPVIPLDEAGRDPLQNAQIICDVTLIGQGFKQVELGDKKPLRIEVQAGQGFGALLSETKRFDSVTDFKVFKTLTVRGSYGGR